MNPQIISLLLAQDNQSVSFDGSTYTITDAKGNVSTFLSEDMQNLLTALQADISQQSSELVARSFLVSAIQSFATNNPVQPGPLPQPPQPAPAIDQAST
jgi:hypothetical protein